MDLLTILFQLLLLSFDPSAATSLITGKLHVEIHIIEQSREHLIQLWICLSSWPDVHGSTLDFWLLKLTYLKPEVCIELLLIMMEERKKGITKREFKKRKDKGIYCNQCSCYLVNDFDMTRKVFCDPVR